MIKKIRALYYDCIRSLKNLDSAKELTKVNSHEALILIGRLTGYLLILRDSGEEELYKEAMKVIKGTKELRLSILTKYERFLEKTIDK